MTDFNDDPVFGLDEANDYDAPTQAIPAVAPTARRTTAPPPKKGGRGQTARLIALGVVLVVVVAGAFYFVTKKPTRTVTAHFAEAVGVYVGSDVRILGIRVGQITKITPHVDNVEVVMTYDAQYKVPANAIATVVPPSIVSDRYLQLSPVYTSGAQLANHADIPLSRTAAPVELDDIYKSLSDLSVALGPTASNPSGPLNSLIEATSKNLSGNGALLGQTFTDLSKAAKTFADSRGNLTDTVKNLSAFSTALASSDAQVRHLDEQLATVAQSLADERASLALALKNLSGALTDIRSFIDTNQGSITTGVTALKNVTQTLVEQKSALNEVLAVIPTAVSNITHAYNPVTGVFDAQAATGSNDDSPLGANSFPSLPQLVTKIPPHYGNDATSNIVSPSSYGVPGVAGTPMVVEKTAPVPTTKAGS